MRCEYFAGEGCIQIQFAYIILGKGLRTINGCFAKYDQGAKLLTHIQGVYTWRGFFKYPVENINSKWFKKSKSQKLQNYA